MRDGLKKFLLAEANEIRETTIDACLIGLPETKKKKIKQLCAQSGKSNPQLEMLDWQLGLLEEKDDSLPKTLFETFDRESDLLLIWLQFRVEIDGALKASVFDQRHSLSLIHI